MADKIKEWYDTSTEKRKEVGLKGREWMLRDDIGMSCTNMCERFVHDMEQAWDKWTPRKRFTLYKA